MLCRDDEESIGGREPRLVLHDLQLRHAVQDRHMEVEQHDRPSGWAHRYSNACWPSAAVENGAAGVLEVTLQQLEDEAST
jgi:hypothetical protein